MVGYSVNPHFPITHIYIQQIQIFYLRKIIYDMKMDTLPSVFAFKNMDYGSRKQ